jgi:hypothetical protein
VGPEIAHTIKTMMETSMNNELAIYESVAALYAEGAEGDESAILEYARPQDFAVRETWSYSLHELTVGGAKFKLHLYVDIPMTEKQKQELALQIVTAGVPDYAASPYGKPAMSPTDCLDEDDFWDSERLGEPNFCDEEVDY